MKHILLFSLLVFLSSCWKLHNPKPEVLIDQHKMVDLLTDLHIADAVADQKVMEKQNDFAVNEAHLNAVLKMHGVDRKVFFENLRYYQRENAAFAVMYSDIAIRLSKKQAEIYGRQKP